MAKAIQEVEIDEISNSAGDLCIKMEDDGQCYLSMEDWNLKHWKKISKSLFDELLNFVKNEKIFREARDCKVIQEVEIGEIGNSDGELCIRMEEDGQCYLVMEDWNGMRWRKISQNLFDELLKFNNGIV